MTIEATAEALAAETALPDVAAPEMSDAPDISEDAELAKIWDGSDAPDDQPEEPPETEEQDAETADEPADEAPDVEQAVEVSEAPTELPKAVRGIWKDLPEAAQSAILDSQREMGRKLADQGRLIQGIAPIQNVLTEAIKDLPALADMRPADLAADVVQLAKVSADFKAKPVETLLGLVKQHGLEEPLKQVLAGEQPNTQTNALLQEISSLKRQITEISNPDYIRGQAEHVISQERVQSEVSNFAETADHWDAVEAVMPQYIEAVRAINADSSPSDLLREAYELAVLRTVPEATKATPAPSDEESAKADPEKTKAAQKAKSVNVKSKPNGKSRALTEDEELSKVWNDLQD